MVNMSFRPLRGLRVSQYGVQDDAQAADRQFPSPAGSSCFSIRGELCLQLLVVPVSVPCGVFVFLNWNIVSDGSAQYIVSVPCGVFVFLNCVLYFEHEGVTQCFRPLRGLRVSQY